METRVITTVEFITPEVAQSYLTRNINNRPIRNRMVEIYAEQMIKGLWRLSNDSICFTHEGNLINGQHRLMAVCKSGIPCFFNVSRGYDEDDIMTMDNGMGRSAGDILYLKDVENSTAVAGIVRRRIILSRHNNVMNNPYKEGGLGGQQNKILNSSINEDYFAHEEIYKYVTAIARTCYKKLRVLVVSEYGAMAAHLILDLNHPQEDVKEFFYEFAGINPDTNNATFLLRTRLINNLTSRTKMSSVMKQKLIIKTWNAYITGKTVKYLQYNEINDKNLWFI